MSDEALVTVLVLNWNGRHLLPDCLDALAKQDLDPSLWRTWVIDNASSDDSLEVLARDHPDVQVIANDENLGFAAGNNVGLRTVGTPFAVLLNNDACPEPEWLGRLLATVRAPGNERVAAVTSKVLFRPRYLRLHFETPGYRTAADPRDLGVQVVRVRVGGQDVTEDILWDNGAYGPEGPLGDQRFRWTRPAGTLLLPMPAATLPEDVAVQVTARAERSKDFTVRWDTDDPAGTGGGDRAQTLTLGTADAVHEVTVPAGTPLVDVVNNVGSVLLAGGYGADRGYQEVDAGQYEEPADVFLMCGAAVCLRTGALHQVGFFDDAFFMYYEDTDLSWRLQAAGWDIRYAPDAVVRHEHSASSVEWSPFFTFHVERNRLLVLARNAPAALAVRQALRFSLTTLSMLRWALLQGVRDRRRPAVRPLLLRARVAASYLRLLPRALADRRRIARDRRRDPQVLLDRWMLSHR